MSAKYSNDRIDPCSQCFMYFFKVKQSPVFTIETRDDDHWHSALLIPPMDVVSCVDHLFFRGLSSSA